MVFWCIYKRAALMPLLRSVGHIEWPLALALRYEDSSDGAWLLMQKDDRCPS